MVKVPAVVVMLFALNGRMRKLFVNVPLPEIVELPVSNTGLAIGAPERVFNESRSPPFRTNGPVPSPNVAVPFRLMMPDELVVAPL
jgi:hypothetical protein